MDTVAIYAAVPFDLDSPRARLGRHWTLLATTPDQIAIAGPIGRVYIYVAGPDERTDEWLGEYAVFIDYGCGLGLVKSVLVVIADDPSLIVDVDLGVVMRGDAIAARIRSDPGWDWRAAWSPPG